MRDLLVVAAPDGTEVARVPAPQPWPRRRPGCGTCSAARPARTARTGVPGGAARPVAAHPGAVARIHARVADLRRDALHQATTALAQRHQVIVIEDLNVTGMSRRKPGAGRGGRGLNRAIADAAMAEVRGQLAKKST